MRWNGWLVLIVLAARGAALRSPAPSGAGASARGAARAAPRPPSMSTVAEAAEVARPDEALVCKKLVQLLQALLPLRSLLAPQQHAERANLAHPLLLAIA